MYLQTSKILRMLIQHQIIDSNLDLIFGGVKRLLILKSEIFLLFDLSALSAFRIHRLHIYALFPSTKKSNLSCDELQKEHTIIFSLLMFIFLI